MIFSINNVIIITNIGIKINVNNIFLIVKFIAFDIYPYSKIYSKNIPKQVKINVIKQLSK